MKEKRLLFLFILLSVECLILSSCKMENLLNGTTSAPKAPNNLSLSGVSSNIINLSWADNSDNEDGFTIERAPDNSGNAGDFVEIKEVSKNTHTYSDADLEADTKYYYRVKSYNSVGDSPYSDIADATTNPVPLTVPDSPDHLLLSVVSSNQINLSWTDNSDNETGFRVERALDSGGSPGAFSQIATLSANTTTYSDSGLTAETKYYYRIFAYNSVGDSPYSDIADATTNPAPVTIPSNPNNLLLSVISYSQINLSWTDNSDNETGFRIERAPDSGGSAGTFSQIATVSANTATYSNTGLSPSTRYYYRVYAYNSAGNSSYSSVVSATTDPVPITIPNAPDSLLLSVVSSSGINLSWSDNSDNETGFRIVRAPDSGGSAGAYSQIATVSANTATYSNTGLSPSTRYYYRVYAYNSAGNSGYTNVANATTLAAPVGGQIIADHTCVDKYVNIPDQYIAIVKTWLVDIAGESHSRGYGIGMNLLETQNLKYSVQTFDSVFPGTTSSMLRLGRHDSVGEEDFFTNAAAIQNIKNIIKQQNDISNPINVLGFGWCYDFTGSYDPTTVKDPVYNIGWAGNSIGGPQGNLPWGLDSGDQAITGNSICMDTYLTTIDDYNSYCQQNGYICKAIFTTGPVDENAGTETGVQREIKHDYIRNYIKSNDGILFDYADILCWNNSNEQNISTWSGHTYQQIHPDNKMDYDENWNIIAEGADSDHIGEVGTLRLAKAMWWLLARMAGWDGQ
ncbi:MAG: fibronectin type III domain-containing protein [Spirochaetota bacterium]